MVEKLREFCICNTVDLMVEVVKGVMMMRTMVLVRDQK